MDEWLWRIHRRSVGNHGDACPAARGSGLRFGFIVQLKSCVIGDLDQLRAGNLGVGDEPVLCLSENCLVACESFTRQCNTGRVTQY